MGIYKYERDSSYSKESKISAEIDREMMDLFLNNYILNDITIKQEKTIKLVSYDRFRIGIFGYRGLSEIDSLSFEVPKVDFVGVSKYGGNSKDRMFITDIDQKIKNKSKKNNY